MAPLSSLVKYDSPVQVAGAKDARGRGLKDKGTRKVRARGAAGHGATVSSSPGAAAI
jgi:hypothetical protein